MATEKMTNNVTVDEILEVTPLISSRMINDLEQFGDEIDEFEKAYAIYSKILNSEDLTNYGNNIQQLQENNIKEVKNCLSKNTSYLEKLTEEIAHLKASESNLLELVANNEKELRALKAKISHIHRKKENLLETRDKVQICKLLTNTSFAYKTTNISGYAVGEITRNIQSFNLNAENLSKNDVTKSLYDVVKKVSQNE